jgi:hypothetical protein
MSEERKNGFPVFDQTPNLTNPEMLDSQRTYGEGKGRAFLILGIFLVILGVAGYFIFKNISKSKVTIKLPDITIALPTSTAGLPDSGLTSTSTPGTSTVTGIEIEYLSFSNFYKEPDNTVASTTEGYELPINVKTDVINYWDVSRRVNLDPGLKSLNESGFAVLDNPAPLEMDNFYSGYKYLADRRVSPLVTADFLTYYYQNLIKQEFRSVEEEVFYDNLWKICQKMLAIASERYNDRLALVGNINDPILEGARMEMAYFATALEILKPAGKEQIGKKEGRINFTTKEAEIYAFTLPEKLKIDVEREVALIRTSKTIVKSPVLLYQRDYKEFAVPSDYANNAKLNNFYLTTRWLNSNFPIYYRSEECPECLLDIDDWRVRMVAATYVAQDIFNDYNLKSKWARIYKVLGYFKGLRSGLTFLSYRDALNNAFGTSTKIEELFSYYNPEMPANFEKFQASVLDFKFLESEGALDKSDPLNYPKLGAAMLLEPYWPNDYVMKQLSYPNVGKYNGEADIKGNIVLSKTNITGCKDKVVKSLINRCIGFGLDIINLLYPVTLANNYFVENTNYEDYESRSGDLKSQIELLNQWNYNSYWSTLKAIKSSLNFDKNILPVYTRNENWEKRDVNRSLAAWANLQTPADIFAAYKGDDKKSTGLTGNNSSDSQVLIEPYVEPNLALVNEFIANAEMIQGMFYELRVGSEQQSAGAGLAILINNLKNI